MVAERQPVPGFLTSNFTTVIRTQDRVPQAFAETLPPPPTPARKFAFSEDLLIKLLAGPSPELRQHWAEEICQAACRCPCIRCTMMYPLSLIAHRKLLEFPPCMGCPFSRALRRSQKWQQGAANHCFCPTFRILARCRRGFRPENLR